MRTILFFLLAALLCNCSSQKALHRTGDISAVKNITVLSYNIHHANPPSKTGVIDMDAIANVINQQQPDVVALQEVDVHTNRSGTSLHQAEELAKLTGMKAYFAKAIDYDGGEYGVAILSKYPMEDMKNTPLPTDDATNGEHRTLATAVIRLPGNKKVLFACTHLDAQRADTNRQLQIKKILEILKQETLPVIIAGDLNAEPTSDVIKQFDNHFTRSCMVDCPFTIPEVHPNKTIDYIAFAPASIFTVVSHSVVDEKYASDHRPVKTILKLK
ncbi:MAG TPA: endonuclease/exonuclease/phosphatase family protein [Chitinophagaceae bacterium]